MTTPRRVQHKRGQAKTDPDMVLVRRPYRFGNPFDWRVHGPETAVALHAEWIINPDSQPITCGKVTYHPSSRREIVARLAGRNLGCNCEPGQPCHADTLLRLAAADPDGQGDR